MPSYRGPVEYRVEAGRTTEGKKSFRKKNLAMKYAQRLADKLGQKVFIEKLWDVGLVDDWTVEPYKPSSGIGAEFNRGRRRNAGYVEKYLIRPSGESATTLTAAKNKAKKVAARIGQATVHDFRGKLLATYTKKAKNGQWIKARAVRITNSGVIQVRK